MDNLKKFWKKKRVLITGHTGFKGSWLCIILNFLNSKIYGYSLAPKKNSLFNKSKIKKFISANNYGDINKIEKLKKFIKKTKPEIVFHLAAQPLVIESYKNPLKTFTTNIMGTANLMEVIKETKSVKSVVIITTDKVYKIDKKQKEYSEDNELGGADPYSASKVSAEVIVNSFIKSFFYKSNLRNKISTARAGNVIGGGDFSKNRLVPDIIKAINNKKKLIIRNPYQIRPWQHVLEPLIGYLLLAEKQYHGKIKVLNNCWNFGPQKKSSKKVIEIVNYIKTIIKFDYKVKANNNIKETEILKLNSLKAKKILGWFTKWTVNDALNKTIEWNNLVKKGVLPKNICEDQLMCYLNKKK